MPASSAARSRRAACATWSNGAGAGIKMISYPNRTAAPRGWSVLEASRAFHIAHASSCGGRGEMLDPPGARDQRRRSCPDPTPLERATLDRLGAEPDVRLACQLRPVGDVAVSPLVLSERPVYRARVPAVDSERDVVLLFCDFSNSEVLARDYMAHDVLFAFNATAESACHAYPPRRRDDLLCRARQFSPCSGCRAISIAHAVRRLRRPPRSSARCARSMTGWARNRGCSKAEIAVSIHTGRVALSKIGQTTDLTTAAGDAVELAGEIRKTAMAGGKFSAVSGPVFAAAKVAPPHWTRRRSPAARRKRAGLLHGYGPGAASEDAMLRNRIGRVATTVIKRIRG